MDPGPRKRLNDELHALHRRAGLPSVREMAREIGKGVASPSRVHDVFTKPRLPSWGLVELLVEHLAGRVPGGRPKQEEVKRFHALWETAAMGDAAAYSVVADGIATDSDAALATLGVENQQQFREALNKLRLTRGLSLRELARASDDGTGRKLPVATLSVSLNKGALPAKQFVVAYLRACGLDQEAQQVWLRAWAVLKRQEDKGHGPEAA
jgi:hypothetical protein